MRAFTRGPMTHPVSIPTNTGDGLRMAMRVGAMLGNMREAWWMPVIEVPADVIAMGRQLLTYERTMPGGLMVNRYGKRFTNEASNYNAFGAAFHEQDVSRFEYANLPCWLIFNRDFYQRYPFVGGLTDGFAAVTDPPQWIARGDTLEALAHRVGIDAGGLTATVARFNANSAGDTPHDPDFRRGESANDLWWGDPAWRGDRRATLAPLGTGPYYAVEVKSGALGTKGGPQTDRDARVLDVDGAAIPGLYAAGNVMASVMGMTYGGAGGILAPAMVFGYRAASMRRGEHAMQGEAAVLMEAGGTLVHRAVAYDAPMPREVLIRVAACGVCHSDLLGIEGTIPAPVPCALGHEAAGVVEAVGSDVIDLAPGDHVVTCLSGFCGQCAECLSGHPNRCERPPANRPEGAPPRIRLGDDDGRAVGQFLWLGAFASHVLVDRAYMVRVRPEMPLAAAALIGCAVTTGVGAVFRTARVEPGSTVAVIGCGGVGLAAINGAALAGASRVIAIDISTTKLNLARTVGATDVVRADEGDPVEQARPDARRGPLFLRGGRPQSHLRAGLPHAARRRARDADRHPAARRDDRNPEQRTAQRTPDRRLADGIEPVQTDVPRYVELYLQGRLHLDCMVSRMLPLARVNDALDFLRAGDGARSVITMDR